MSEEYDSILDSDNFVRLMMERGVLDKYNDLRHELWLLVDNLQPLCAGRFNHSENDGYTFSKGLKDIINQLPVIYYFEEDDELMDIALMESEKDE